MINLILAYWQYFVVPTGIYVFGAIVFLLWVKLDVDETGQPYLNPTRLHFKITKPLLNIHEIKGTLPISICSYYFKFLVMLFGWIALGFLASVKTIVYIPFMALFGYYPVANLKSIKNDGNPLAVEPRKFWLPKVKGNRFFPAYIILPLLYIWSLVMYSPVRYGSLAVVVVVAVFAALIWYLDDDNNNDSVRLTKAWLAARKQKFCILLPVKNDSDPAAS